MIGSWGNWCEVKFLNGERRGEALGFVEHDKVGGRYVVVVWKGSSRFSLVAANRLLHRTAYAPNHWTKIK